MLVNPASVPIHLHAQGTYQHSLSLWQMFAFSSEAKQWYLKMVSFVSSCRTYAHERIVGVFYQLRIIYLIVRKHTLTQNSWVKLGVKTFHQGHLEFHNWLIFYYDTPHTARVRQLRMRVVPVIFRPVLMSVCHVSLLSGYSHDHRTLFRILESFWLPMFTKWVSQFIRSFAHF